MQAITLWLLEQAPLGHKCPRPGRQSRYHHCPACVDMVDRRPRLTCRSLMSLYCLEPLLNCFYVNALCFASCQLSLLMLLL